MIVKLTCDMDIDIDVIFLVLGTNIPDYKNTIKYSFEIQQPLEIDST